MMIQDLYSNERDESSYYSFHSKPKEENNLDPDEGNSRLCSACNLPIFLTPFKKTESGSGYLHDQCSNLPIDLDGSDLHNSLKPLRKQPNLHKSKCSKCDAVCGDVLYRCRDMWCKFQLDVTCAWPVKILHRSHDHRLSVNRCSRGLSCSACGTDHRQGLLGAEPMPLVYVCSACDFWLHPYCAALPNAIQHERHPHPLLLDYRARLTWSECAICEDEVSSWGFYSCTVCDYHVHIMCAVGTNLIFEPVPLLEALENRVPGLVHFPVPNEYTSIVRHIAECTASTSDELVNHQHELTLHRYYPAYNDDEEIDDDVHRLPKCNGCVQFISPPFYTCSQCPKLFLHDCCARLPRFVTRSPHSGRNRPAGMPIGRSPHIGRLFGRSPHMGRHHPSGMHIGRSPHTGRRYPAGMLIGLNSQDEYSSGISTTTCCNRLTNGFTYTFFNHNRDIICSLMPDSITHAAHAKTHVLRSTYVQRVEEMDPACHCCNDFLDDISYNCTTCRNFSLHATCAQLPATVRHVYDPHPLELVTAPPPHVQTQVETFCDACEEILDSTKWYYGCADCEQTFHVDCVSCLDQLSLIKYEVAEVRVVYHECPLTLVRGHMVCGRRCGRCGEGYRKYRLALECFKCNFSIHVSCLGRSSSQLFRKSKRRLLGLNF